MLLNPRGKIRDGVCQLLPRGVMTRAQQVSQSLRPRRSCERLRRHGRLRELIERHTQPSGARIAVESDEQLQFTQRRAQARQVCRCVRAGQVGCRVSAL